MQNMWKSLCNTITCTLQFIRIKYHLQLYANLMLLIGWVTAPIVVQALLMDTHFDEANSVKIWSYLFTRKKCCHKVAIVDHLDLSNISLYFGSWASHAVVPLCYHILFFTGSLNYLYYGYLIYRGSYVCGQTFEWKNLWCIEPTAGIIIS